MVDMLANYAAGASIGELSQTHETCVSTNDYPTFLTVSGNTRPRHALNRDTPVETPGDASWRTPPCRSDATETQLSLWNWATDSRTADEITAERYIAQLERDAEGAMFDWVECRRAPHASALWCIFAHKAFLLEKALAKTLKPRSSFVAIK